MYGVLFQSEASPRIRRELLKFKLTNQNSASWKNCAIRRHFNCSQLKGQKTIEKVLWQPFVIKLRRQKIQCSILE